MLSSTAQPDIARLARSQAHAAARPTLASPDCSCTAGEADRIRHPHDLGTRFNRRPTQIRRVRGGSRPRTAIRTPGGPQSSRSGQIDAPCRIGIDCCSSNRISERTFCVPPECLALGWSHPVGTIVHMSSADRHDEEAHFHLFTVDDPRLWEFQSRLDEREFTISDVSDEEWDNFHAIIAEA